MRKLILENPLWGMDMFCKFHGNMSITFLDTVETSERKKSYGGEVRMSQQWGVTTFC